MMKSFFTLTLLLAPFSVAHIASPCEDNENAFDLPNNLGTSRCEFAHFNPSACDAQVYKENCPNTCNNCCGDHEGLFDSSENELINRSSSCDMVSTKPHLCDSELVKEHCPNSCGLCPCRDDGGRFFNKANNLVSCERAKTHGIKCRNSVFNEHCPVSCDSCPDRPSNCNIVAEIDFPNSPGTEYYGYHNDIVTVTKNGEDEICSWENTATSWGCSHEGDAYIFKTGPNYQDFSSTETAAVNNAQGGTFTFHLQHYFNSTLESYYDNDHTIQGVLSITPTNHQVEKFSHPKNEGQDTHNSDGSVNMDYKGNLIVTVQCNDSCQCTMQEEIL